MDDTTTLDGGAEQTAQPTQTSEAVSLGEKGAPTLRSKDAPTSPPQSQTQTEEAVTEPTPQPTEEAKAPDTQADDPSDIQAWAEKKGIDLENADPVKLAQMIRESEKRMHEATAQARELETTINQNPNLDYTGDQNYDALAMEINQIKIQNRVNDFFSSHPDARELESQMAQIVQDRPHLQNDLDALYALAANSPSRTAELKRDGGREALTNLAQKQSAIPPTSNASTGTTSSREVITPDNVDDLVGKHDLEWFKKNKLAIDKAMAGAR